MHKKIILTFFIIYILTISCLALLFIVLYFGLTHELPEVKDEDILVAENSIIKKVGQDYFNKNYILNKTKSYRSNSGASIYYEYLPASRLHKEKEYLVAHIDNGQFKYMNGLYDCLSNHELCELNISEEEALAIVKQNGFFDDYNGENYKINTFLNPSVPELRFWSWSITKKGDVINDCWDSAWVYIHARTGKMSGIKSGTGCY